MDRKRRGTKTICMAGPAKPTGEAEGTVHQPASRVLLVPARLLEPWSWGLLQAGSQPALSHWKHPPRRDKETRRARQASGAIRLLASLSYRSASVPQRPLTRMQAATTSATVETRFFPTLTPTPADLHQLSFQHKPKGSSREPPPPQPRPDTRAEVTRTRSTH